MSGVAVVEGASVPEVGRVTRVLGLVVSVVVEVELAVDVVVEVSLVPGWASERDVVGGGHVDGPVDVVEGVDVSNGPVEVVEGVRVPDGPYRVSVETVDMIQLESVPELAAVVLDVPPLETGVGHDSSEVTAVLAALVLIGVVRLEVPEVPSEALEELSMLAVLAVPEVARVVAGVEVKTVVDDEIKVEDDTEVEVVTTVEDDTGVDEETIVEVMADVLFPRLGVAEVSVVDDASAVPVEPVAELPPDVVTSVEVEMDTDVDVDVAVEFAGRVLDAEPPSVDVPPLVVRVMLVEGTTVVSVDVPVVLTVDSAVLLDQLWGLDVVELTGTTVGAVVLTVAL